MFLQYQNNEINYCQLVMNRCKFLPEEQFQSAAPLNIISVPHTNLYRIYFPIKFNSFSYSDTINRIRRLFQFTPAMKCEVKIDQETTTNFLIVLVNRSPNLFYILTLVNPEHEDTYVLAAEMKNFENIVGNGGFTNGHY